MTVFAWTESSDIAYTVIKILKERELRTDINYLNAIVDWGIFELVVWWKHYIQICDTEATKPILLPTSSSDPQYHAF